MVTQHDVRFRQLQSELRQASTLRLEIARHEAVMRGEAAPLQSLAVFYKTKKLTLRKELAELVQAEELQHNDQRTAVEAEATEGLLLLQMQMVTERNEILSARQKTTNIVYGSPQRAMSKSAVLNPMQHLQKLG